jgi:hypothetical protein
MSEPRAAFVPRAPSRPRRGGGRISLVALLCGILASPARAAEPKAGAYCPIPEPGKPSTCLQPDQPHYKEFLGALDGGAVSEDASARVESEVEAGARGERPYEALSTLAFGYYLLAKRAAETPGTDPVLQARLERWNDVLARAYARSETDTGYRDAVRAAAEDVHRRAPPVGLRCTDASGATAHCDSTEAVIRGIDAARDETGVRGQLARLFGRLFGSEP